MEVEVGRDGSEDERGGGTGCREGGSGGLFRPVESPVSSPPPPPPSEPPSSSLVMLARLARLLTEEEEAVDECIRDPEAEDFRRAFILSIIFIVFESTAGFWRRGGS